MIKPSLKNVTALMKDKKYEEALDQIKVLLKADPSNYSLLIYGGNAMFNTGGVSTNLLFYLD